MAIIEYHGSNAELTRTQRWGHYLTVIMAIVCVIYGLNQRNNTLNATEFFDNPEAGFSVRYPSNWLIDENGDGYIFRVRDMSNRGFKTTLQIDVETISDQTSPWNILIARMISRAVTLAVYETYSIEEIILDDNVSATQMDYTFTFTEINPILESIPTVAIGRDILIIRDNQAIIISYHADIDIFQDNLDLFDRFLESIEFQ